MYHRGLWPEHPADPLLRGPRLLYLGQDDALGASMRLLFLLLSCLAASVLAATAARAGYQPTGDALYDRYAQAVLAQPGWPPLNTALNELNLMETLRPLYVNPLTLRDETLAQWEGEFGADPRYWQLRAYCYAFRKCRALGDDDEPDLAGGARLLREGWERGAADAETLLLIHTWEGWATGQPVEREQERPLREALLARGYTAQGLAWMNEWDMEDALEGVELDIPEYYEIAPRFEQEELNLLNAAIALGPDECWPYWRRAIYRLYYGEPELGLADLRAGNAASDCRYPMCFPVSFVYDELAAGRVAGDKALAGLLIEEAADSGALHSIRDTIVLKERYKEAVVIYNLSGDHALLAEIYVMGTRIGQSDRRSVYTSYISSLLCSLPALDLLRGGEVVAGAPRLTPLVKIKAAWETVQVKISGYQFERMLEDPGLGAFYVGTSAYEDYRNELYLAVNIGMTVFDPMPQPAMPQYIQDEADTLYDPLVRGPRLWDAWRQDYEFVAGNLDGMFETLAEYDMRALTAPEAQEWESPGWD